MATSITTFGNVGASGLFPGQSGNTLAAVDLTDANINGGNIALADDGSEVIFNMLNHFHDVISDQSPSNTLTNLTSTVSTSLSGSTLTKTYNFTVKLNFTGVDVATLNVVDESGD